MGAPNSQPTELAFIDAGVGRARRPARRVSWANVASALALLLSMGSATAVALPMIGSAGIINGSVRSIDLKNLDVRASDLATGSVTTAKLRTSAVRPSKLAGRAVTTPKLATWAVTAPKITNGAVTTPKLVDGSVTSSKLADGAVTSASLATGAIGAAALDVVPAAAAERSLNQNVPTGIAGVEVALSSEQLDSGSIHSGTSGTFVAPIDGVYVLHGGVTWSPFAGPSEVRVTIRNTAGVETSHCPSSTNDDLTGSIGTTLTTTCMRRLLAGESMQLRAAQISGVTRGVSWAEASFWRIGA